MPGTNFNNYPSLAQVLAADTLLVLHAADESASSSGTVHQASATSFVVTIRPSGDTSGATDAANVNAALAGLPASGGVITLAATAEWYVECGQVSAKTGQYISALGCLVSAVGAGDVFRWVDTSAYADRTIQGGGLLGEPLIDGTSTTGNSSGVHAGDILQLSMYARVQNFTAGTTSKGVWFDNQNYWTEQMKGRIFVQNCTQHVVFDMASGAADSAGGSFDRPDLAINVIQGEVTQDGVVLQNGAYITDGPGLSIAGNFIGNATPPTSAVLRISGTVAAGHTDAGTLANISSCGLVIGTECDITEGQTGPITIAFGSASNYISDCVGVMNFEAAGQNFQSSVNVTAGVNFTFGGPISGDGTLAGNYVGDLTTSRVTVYGGADNPFVMSGDSNGLPLIENPNGLYSYVEQSQQAASATIGSVTTETALVSLAVPENDPVTGAIYKLTGYAIVTGVTGAPTLTWRIRWGGTSGTALAVTGAISLVSGDTSIWELEGLVTFASASTATGKLRVIYNTNATSTSPGREGAGTVMLAVTTTATTVTVSSSESLVLTAAFSAADSQSLTGYGYAERVA